jgi:integron integrase
MMTHQQLFADVRLTIRASKLSQRTEDAYTDWIYRFLCYHRKRDPFALGPEEVNQFLSYLYKDCNKSASSQNQALCAISFYYKDVLKRPLPSLKYARAAKENPFPVVYTREEVVALLSQLTGIVHLQASLLYGAGLRVMEVMQLRVKDIDLQGNKIHVWQPDKDSYRTTLLPVSLKPALAEQMYQITLLHQKNINEGFGETYLPPLLADRYPEKAKELSWQFLFPAARRVTHPHTGTEVLKHSHESVLQKAVKEAITRAGLNPGGSCHTLRHSFAVHMLEAGFKVEAVRELLGHHDVRTTLIYTRMLAEKPDVVRSPLDCL